MWTPPGTPEHPGETLRISLSELDLLTSTAQPAPQAPLVSELFPPPGHFHSAGSPVATGTRLPSSAAVRYTLVCRREVAPILFI